MIYTPQKNPKEAVILITLIVLVGILGGLFVHPYFLVVALLFWIQYTVVLSYLQFKRGSKHGSTSITELLLHPQVRFFLFEALAFSGLFAVLVYNKTNIGIISLIIWELFAVNFYIYYKK